MSSNGHREERVLELDGVVAGYRPHRSRPVEVVGPVDATVGRHEMVCVVGPNGAGKSTLLRTVAGVQPAVAGRVLLEGEEVVRLAPRDRARRLAVVLTERPDLGMLTGREIVALGRYPYTRWDGRLDGDDHEAVERALRQTGSTALAERHLGELSDGQRQRLMIARALAQEPGLLLLDEPTAFLDVSGRVELTGLLRRLAHDAGVAVLLSSHDLELALRVADRFWLLTAGGRFSVGTARELIDRGELERAFQSDELVFDAHDWSFRPRP